MTKLEQALSGTHEIRVIIRAQTPEELLAWHQIITNMRYQEGCIDVYMGPVEPIIQKIDIEFPKDGPIQVESINVVFEEINFKE